MILELFQRHVRIFFPELTETGNDLPPDLVNADTNIFLEVTLSFPNISWVQIQLRRNLSHELEGIDEKRDLDAMDVFTLPGAGQRT